MTDHPHHWIGTHDHGPVCSVCGMRKPEGGDEGLRSAVAAALRAAAREQRAEAENVPWDDEGTHADGHRCAADFLDRRAATLDGPV
jgi:hypothetical protein